MRIFDDRKDIKEKTEVTMRGRTTANIKFLRSWKGIGIKGRGKRTGL